ncbi:MAG: N-acetyl-gamma-glutamyl-phosphate reductase [Myxococcota bacterium]
MKRVGVVGARGHTGAELIRLIDRHPELTLAFAGSRRHAGTPVAEVVEGLSEASTLEFEAIVADSVARRVADTETDAVVLALPNGAAPPFVAALPASVVIVDLSADHRFDEGWRYGLVERARRRLWGARRIANPGCYATGAQLALGPLVDDGAVDGAPRIFGVSGFSGAGTSPSPRNDPERLRDNLIPYALVGHVHEREITRHLHPVHFCPHVAPHFRGISLTIDVTLRPDVAPEPEALVATYRARYADEPLVEVVAEAPEVRDIQGRHAVHLGGFAVQGQRVVIVATIDNLLKGAATQAVQNLNLGLELEDVWSGIPVGDTSSL